MGRPPLALGTPGAIRYYKTATGYRARVLVRDYDGHVRALERRGAHQDRRRASPEARPARPWAHPGRG